MKKDIDQRENGVDQVLSIARKRQPTTSTDYVSGLLAPPTDYGSHCIDSGFYCLFHLFFFFNYFLLFQWLFAYGNDTNPTQDT